MITSDILWALIPVAATILGAVLGIAGYRRTFKSDAKQEGAESAIMLTELGYIKSSVDDVKKAQNATNEQFTELKVRQAQMERDLKSAFVSIREIKDDIDKHHP